MDLIGSSWSEIFCDFLSWVVNSWLYFGCGIVGSLFVVSKILRILRIIYQYFIRSRINFIKNYGKGYALITHALQNNGQYYAHQLAKMGFNLILIDSQKNKLTQLSQHFQQHYNITILIIKFDFGKHFSLPFYSKLIRKTQYLPIQVIVNNLPQFEPIHFQSIPYSQISNIINQNLVSCTFTMKILLDQMLAKNKRSLIINVSSLASVGRFPHMSLYGATSAYIKILSKSLVREFAGKVDILNVQSLIPLTNQLELFNHKNKWGSISPQKAVSNQFDAAGHHNSTCDCWQHQIIKSILKTKLNCVHHQIQENAQKWYNSFK